MYERIEQMSKYIDDMRNQSSHRCIGKYKYLYLYQIYGESEEELGGTGFEQKAFVWTYDFIMHTYIQTYIYIHAVYLSTQI